MGLWDVLVAEVKRQTQAVNHISPAARTQLSSGV